MIKQQFHYDQSVSSSEFEQEIDAILTEVNAYIPKFVTRSNTPSRQKTGLIFGVAMSVVSGLFSAWKLYKDRRFKQNLHRTLKYIINEQKALRTGILTNKGNLLSLAEITSANFKDIKDDFHNLQGNTSRKFDQYLISVLHSYVDTVLYRNYLFFYTNVIHKLDHDLNLINHNIERAKTICT